MSKFAASLVLAVLTLPVGSTANADSRAQDNSKANHRAEVALTELPALDSIAAQLDLRIASPRNAYAITGSPILRCISSPNRRPAIPIGRLLSLPTAARSYSVARQANRG